MKNIGIGLSAAAVLLLVLVSSGCEQQAGSSASAPAEPPEVGVLLIEPESVTLTTELPGRTVPHMVAEVRPQANGILQERLFTEGADVREDEELYRIDPATYQAAYARARATLARAETNLLPVRLEEDRYRSLVKINAVSQQAHDNANAALKQAEAEVEAAQAALQAARINLDYATIKAPIAGRIGRSSVTTGALLTASQPAPLATIQQLDPMYVDVTQSSVDLLRLKQNLAAGLFEQRGTEPRVHLVLEDGSAYPLTGRLRFSEVSVDQSTGSITLRTIFPNPDQLLLPGMFVRAIIEEGVSEQAILVPQRGVTRNPAGDALVMVVDAEEKVSARVIEVERTIGSRWLVRTGLEAGDRVILEGIQKVRPGTRVKAVPFGPPASTAPGAVSQN